MAEPGELHICRSGLWGMKFTIAEPHVREVRQEKNALAFFDKTRYYNSHGNRPDEFYSFGRIIKTRSRRKPKSYCINLLILMLLMNQSESEHTITTKKGGDSG